jgi:alanyl-tRNA synthetase
VFIARGADLDFNCGQILREALAQLGLRGGGTAGLAQGEVPAEQETALQAFLSHVICKAASEAHKQLRGQGVF